MEVGELANFLTALDSLKPAVVTEEKTHTAGTGSHLEDINTLVASPMRPLLSQMLPQLLIFPHPSPTTLLCLVLLTPQISLYLQTSERCH